MKKLVKIAIGLVLLMAPMTMSAQSAAEAREVLSNYCEAKNQEVPIKDGDADAYYMMYGFEDNQMNIVYGVNEELFAVMNENREAALQTLVEEILSNEELLGIVAYLTMCDGTLAVIAVDYNKDASDSDNQLIFAFEEDDIKAIIAKASEE